MKLTWQLMKKNNLEIEDNLRSEYDLQSLKIRKFGSKRKSFAQNNDVFKNGCCKDGK